MSVKQRSKQLGQGMTEYIIIVALIAIAAITVYNLFGDTVRGQVGNMAAELGGSDGSSNVKQSGESARDEFDKTYELSDFQQSEGGS